MILFILVLYLANRDDISSVVEQTELRDVIARRFGGETGSEFDGPRSEDRDEDEEPAPDPEPAVRFTDPTPQDGPTAVEPAPVTPADPASQTGVSNNTPQPRRPDEPSAEPSNGSAEPAPDPAPAETVGATRTVAVTEPQTRIRTSRLYYIRVNDTGLIEPIAVERQVSYVDAPLSATISALIAGPTREELSGGLLNLLPEDVVLLGAWVREGVAYLNFNESFRFNPLGVEGLLAQLQQIVFSATEFSTVERVQILIDGESIDYLSGDGIFVGRPIARSDFYAGGG